MHSHASASIARHNDQWLFLWHLDTCCEASSGSAFRRLHYTSHRIQIILGCLHKIAEPSTLFGSSFPDGERVYDLSHFCYELCLLSILSSFIRGIFVLFLGHHSISFRSLRLYSVIVCLERHGFQRLIASNNLLYVLQCRLCILDFLHLLLLKYLAQTVDDLQALLLMALFVIERGRGVLDENFERANSELSQWNTFGRAVID